MKLDQSFNLEDFKNWVLHYLPSFNLDERIVEIPQSFKEVNKILTLGESDIGVRVFVIESELDPTNRKISLAKDSFNLIKNYGVGNALIAYYSKNFPSWRVSLLTSKPQWIGGKTIIKLSNPKRQSFILGPKAKVATPNNFLLKKGSISDLNDLKKRFSLEVVNKEFYDEISFSFIKLVGGTKLISRNSHYFEPTITLPIQGNRTQKHIEFAVRLIGRIIFCWFLKEKRSTEGDSLIPKELISSESVLINKNYYHTILEPIFFEILNKNFKNRKEKYCLPPFSKIPYLNGGLFSPQEDDFFSYVDNKQMLNNEKVIVPDEWIQSLFEVLETFNFTIDENTSLDEELSIDPEMLGRIFENLLAEINPETEESARKNTGSYYTPREIVDFMVDESLAVFLTNKTKIAESKIRALISYDLEDDLENPLTESEKEEIVEELETVKILDPACGSGAFPIGALQKIVFILQQADPHGVLWFKKQIKKTPNTLLRKVIEREFKEKNFDYIRKLGIIQDNIFGVDLQPIATEISRLRCFLTLVVDERIEDDSDNRGIEPLPNLDFKFVTANTLIGLPKFNKAQNELFDNHSKIDQLKELIHSYFSSRDEERKDIMLSFSELQTEMINELIDQHSYTGAIKAELTRKLTDWKPFKHRSTDWFDAEWMFGITDGFDIILANPPYVDSESMVKNSPDLREKYNQIYETANGNWDLFVIFIELGAKLLNEKGILTYIVPNKLIGAEYSEKLREYMLKTKVNFLRDYSEIKVFKDADVYPIVFQISNDIKDGHLVKVEKMQDLENFAIQNKVPSHIFYEDIFWDKFYVEEDKLQLLLKISKFPALSTINSNISGAATVSEAYKIKELILEKTQIDAEKYFKLINTGTIDPYRSLWGIKNIKYLGDSYITPIVRVSDLEERFFNRFKQARSNKIIIGGMSKKLEAILDKGEYLAGKSTIIIIENQSIELATLLAILNSKLISFWYKNMFKSLSLQGGYLRIGSNEIKKIPIAKADNETTIEIKNLVEKIITLFANLEDINSITEVNNYIKDLDNIIYKLYGISKIEISLINNEDL